MCVTYLIVVVPTSQDRDEDHVTVRQRDHFMMIDRISIEEAYIIWVIAVSAENGAI